MSDSHLEVVNQEQQNHTQDQQPNGEHQLIPENKLDALEKGFTEENANHSDTDIKEGLISIENFSENGPLLINSPRSLLACEIHGLKPSDLLVKKKEDIQRMLKDKFANKMPQEAFKQLSKAIESKRLLRVESVKKTRQEMILNEQGNEHSQTLILNQSVIKMRNRQGQVSSTGFRNWRCKSIQGQEGKSQLGLTQLSHATTISSQGQQHSSTVLQNHNGNGTSTFRQHLSTRKGSWTNGSRFEDQSPFGENMNSSLQIQFEKMKEKSEKNLEKIKKRQKIDIQQMVEGELELRRFQMVNELKEKKMLENIQEQRRILDQRKRSCEESWKKKDEARQEKMEQYMISLAKTLKENEEAEMRREENEKLKKRIRLEEARKKEAAMKQTREQCLKQILFAEQKAEEKIIERQNQHLKKEQLFREKVNQVSKERTHRSQEHFEKQQERFKKCIEKQEKQIRNKSQEFTEKIIQSEQRKLDLEKARQKTVEESRKKMEEKQKEASQKNEETELGARKKGEEFVKRLKEHEIQHEKDKQISLMELKSRFDQKRQKEEAANAARQNYEKELQVKLQTTFSQKELKEQEAERRKEKKKKQIAERNNSALFIRTFQVEDNKDKISNQVRFNNYQLQKRILNQQQRLQNLEQEKTELRKQMEQIGRNSERAKQLIKDKIEKKFHKSNKVNPLELVKEFDLDIKIPPELEQLYLAENKHQRAHTNYDEQREEIEDNYDIQTERNNHTLQQEYEKDTQHEQLQQNEKLDQQNTSQNLGSNNPGSNQQDNINHVDLHNPNDISAQDKQGDQHQENQNQQVHQQQQQLSRSNSNTKKDIDQHRNSQHQSQEKHRSSQYQNQDDKKQHGSKLLVQEGENTFLTSV